MSSTTPVRRCSWWAEDQEQTDKILDMKDEPAQGQEKVIYTDPKGMRDYDDPLLLMFWPDVEEIGRRLRPRTTPGFFEESMAKSDR